KSTRLRGSICNHPIAPLYSGGPQSSPRRRPRDGNPGERNHGWRPRAGSGTRRQLAAPHQDPSRERNGSSLRGIACHSEIPWRAVPAFRECRRRGPRSRACGNDRDRRSSRQIEEDLRGLGADLSTSAGQDTSAIGFAGLSEFAEPLLQLVNELAREASFPEGEFERERRQKLEEVKLERTQPGFLAGERLRKVLFGAHPYAQISPSVEQVQAYKREDLLEVYRDLYTPENALLVLVGDFDPSGMLKAVERAFGDWRGKRPEAKMVAPPAAPRGRRVYLVDLPGAVQTQILA